jgi:hypothetical protein
MRVSIIINSLLGITAIHIIAVLVLVFYVSIARFNNLHLSISNSWQFICWIASTALLLTAGHVLQPFIESINESDNASFSHRFGLSLIDYIYFLTLYYFTFGLLIATIAAFPILFVHSKWRRRLLSFFLLLGGLSVSDSLHLYEEPYLIPIFLPYILLVNGVGSLINLAITEVIIIKNWPHKFFSEKHSTYIGILLRSIVVLYSGIFVNVIFYVGIYQTLSARPTGYLVAEIEKWSSLAIYSGRWFEHSGLNIPLTSNRILYNLPRGKSINIALCETGKCAKVRLVDYQEIDENPHSYWFDTQKGSGRSYQISGDQFEELTIQSDGNIRVLLEGLAGAHMKVQYRSSDSMTIYIERHTKFNQTSNDTYFNSAEYFVLSERKFDGPWGFRFVADDSPDGATKIFGAAKLSVFTQQAWSAVPLASNISVKTETGDDTVLIGDITYKGQEELVVEISFAEGMKLDDISLDGLQLYDMVWGWQDRLPQLNGEEGRSRPALVNAEARIYGGRSVHVLDALGNVRFGSEFFSLGGLDHLYTSGEKFEFRITGDTLQIRGDADFASLNGVAINKLTIAVIPAELLIALLSALAGYFARLGQTTVASRKK